MAKIAKHTPSRYLKNSGISLLFPESFSTIKQKKVSEKKRIYCISEQRNQSFKSLLAVDVFKKESFAYVYVRVSGRRGEVCERERYRKKEREREREQGNVVSPFYFKF